MLAIAPAEWARQQQEDADLPCRNSFMGSLQNRRVPLFLCIMLSFRGHLCLTVHNSIHIHAARWFGQLGDGVPPPTALWADDSFLGCKREESRVKSSAPVVLARQTADWQPHTPRYDLPGRTLV